MEVTCRFQFLSCLLLASFLSVSCGSKILGLFPHPGYSHFKSFSPIFQELAERRHNVTLVTYFPTKKPHPNYNEVILKGAHPLNSFGFNIIRPSTAIRKAWHDFFLLQRFAKEACTMFFESNAVELILASHAEDPFDLIIVEIFNTDCTLGLAHLLDKPIVALSSCVLMPWHYNRVGLPDFPSYIPSQFTGYEDDMVYWERLLNFIATNAMKLLYKTTELMDNDLIRKYLNIDVDVQLIAKKTSLLLINEHYSINGARPLSARVVDVGGIHISAKSKSLPQDLKKFLNESKDGVIFISWGSLVKSSSLPNEKIIGMVNAMKKLKERIIWKWDGETKPVESDQFFIANWMQQKDVLSCGSKILALITHPGFSHFKSFSQVLYGLAAERNHNMTIVTYFPTKSPHQNYNEIILKGFYPLNSYDFDTIRPASAISKSLREFLFLQDIGISACKVFFESHAMDLIWKSNAESPFDLVIMEAFNTDCTLGLAHILQKPIVLLSSCVLMPWHYDRVGLPDFPSYISSQFAGFTDDMTYLERLFSFIATKGLKLLYRGTENSNNDMIREYLNLDIDVRDIAKNVSLILVNQHFSTHGSRPLSNRVVEVGGMHISNKSEALPQDLDKFLNESRDGVIFISWGSLVKASSLPESKVIGMVNAMKKLKERIVWKWDGETKPVESDQFFVTNWVQQTDILCKYTKEEFNNNC